MITLETDATLRRRAKIPHELFTVNTVIVHLFLTLSLIKMFGFTMSEAVPLSIGVSCLIIVFTFFRTKKAKTRDAQLIYLHWQLSLNRYRLLIGAYVFYFLINGLSLLFVDGTQSMDGTNITDSILGLLSAVPLFFSVLVSVVLGSGSMFNAGRGEISEKMIEKYPQ